MRELGSLIRLKKHNKNRKRVKEVIAFVKQSGGEYAMYKCDYKNKALTILSDYQESEYKSSLVKMIDYVVERKI